MHILSAMNRGCYANPLKAKLELGWKAEKDISEMCQDPWRWQLKNPNGYDTRKAEKEGKERKSPLSQ